MSKFVVMVQIDQDGEAVCEYTGVRYDTYEMARAEFFKAKEDAQVFCAWIEIEEVR